MTMGEDEITTIQYSQRARRLALIAAALVLGSFVQRLWEWRQTNESVRTAGSTMALLIAACAVLLLPVLIRKPSSLSFLSVFVVLLLSSAEFVYNEGWLGPGNSCSASTIATLAHAALFIGVLLVREEEKAFGNARRARGTAALR